MDTSSIRLTFFFGIMSSLYVNICLEYKPNFSPRSNSFSNFSKLAAPGEKRTMTLDIAAALYVRVPINPSNPQMYFSFYF
jgi:hypothetical protein